MFLLFVLPALAGVALLGMVFDWLDFGSDDGPEGVELTGTEGADSLAGMEGPKMISGLSGADTLEGMAGDDTILGGAGKDLIEGGAGNDSLSGLKGDDTLAGQAGDDRLNGGEGDDDIYGGTGDNTVFGNDGYDIIAGWDGADSLVGGAGTDFILGGAGADTLLGDAGHEVLSGTLAVTVEAFAKDADTTADKMHGGAGNDTFFVNAGDIACGDYDEDTFNVLVRDDGAAVSYLIDFDPEEDEVVAVLPEGYAGAGEVTIEEIATGIEGAGMVVVLDDNPIAALPLGVVVTPDQVTLVQA